MSSRACHQKYCLRGDAFSCLHSPPMRFRCQSLKSSDRKTTIGVAILCTLILLQLATVTARASESESGGKDPPAVPQWRFDLRQLGYPHRLSEYSRNRYHTPPATLAFADDKNLAVTFIDPDAEGARATNAQAEGPLRIYATTFDALTGEVRSKASWLTPNPNDGVVAAREGTLVVRSGNRLALRTPTWQRTKEIDVGMGRGTGEGLFSAYASPTGQSMLLELLAGRGRDYLWLETGSLRIVRTFSEGGGADTISDRQVAGEYDPSPSACEVRVGKPGERKSTIFKSDYCAIVPTFINDDLIAVVQGPCIALLRSNGEILGGLEFHRKDYISRVTPSANGRRFAFTVSVIRNVWEIFGPQWEIPKRLLVYDVALGKWITEIRIKGYKKREEFSVALSPDGLLLATMTNGIVEVFKLSATL